MKYGVDCGGEIAENTKTDDFEKARSTAIAYSNWNIPCSIVELESGFVLKSFEPYENLFKQTYSKPVQPIS